MGFYKTDDPRFAKDPKSGLVVTSDTSEWERYKQERARARELNDIREQVRRLMQEIEELKSLVIGKKYK